MKKTYFFVYLQFVLQGCFTFHLWSAVSLHPCGSLSILSVFRHGSASSTYSLSQTAVEPFQAVFEMHLLNKRDKRDQVSSLAACSIGKHYCCLRSDYSLMWPNRQRKREVYHRLWTSSFSFWVAECSPSHEYQGQPASIIHNPAVLRCPYLHLYCRTSKWLSLFNIAAAEGPARVALRQKKVCTGGRLMNL